MGLFFGQNARNSLVLYCCHRFFSRLEDDMRLFKVLAAAIGAIYLFTLAQLLLTKQGREELRKAIADAQAQGKRDFEGFSTVFDLPTTPERQAALLEARKQEVNNFFDNQIRLYESLDWSAEDLGRALVFVESRRRDTLNALQ
jgi:hypothetical protein